MNFFECYFRHLTGGRELILWKNEASSIIILNTNNCTLNIREIQEKIP